MAEATLKCDYYDGDQIRAEISDNRVALERCSDGRRLGDAVFATPAGLRVFVRQLLELADDIDGGEKVDARSTFADRRGRVWVAGSPVPRVPVASMRGDFVKQAKELLAGTDHDAADIVRLAEFLAAE
ncbi:hypothetical protein [Streptomyces fractus]|uniref:hypothetical protein n=1 Tax=Streptomyces fractus TaxID=641806 RepID=UPI003CEFF80F